MTGTEVNLEAVNGSVSETGVAHGAELLAFTEAVMGSDDAALAHSRQVLRGLLSDEQFVDVCGVIGAFNVVTRVADATGIPLDDMMFAISGDVRRQLNLARFHSSANTPGARD